MMMGRPSVRPARQSSTPALDTTTEPMLRSNSSSVRGRGESPEISPV